jgi:hypothetical protein
MRDAPNGPFYLPRQPDPDDTRPRNAFGYLIGFGEAYRAYYERRDQVVSLLRDLDELTRAYIECALWSSTDNADDSGGKPLDASYSAEDIAPETLREMIEECRQFQADNAADIGAEHARAGHDFWLTRNGHGAGFWDRPEVYGQAQADRLSEACEPWGSYDLYVGDDGQIYGS